MSGCVVIGMHFRSWGGRISALFRCSSDNETGSFGLLVLRKSCTIPLWIRPIENVKLVRIVPVSRTQRFCVFLVRHLLFLYGRRFSYPVAEQHLVDRFCILTRSEKSTILILDPCVSAWLCRTRYSELCFSRTVCTICTQQTSRPVVLYIFLA